MSVNTFKLELKISVDRGYSQYCIWATKTNDTGLHEIWSNWKPSIVEAFIDFQKELDDIHTRDYANSLDGEQK